LIAKIWDHALAAEKSVSLT